MGSRRAGRVILSSECIEDVLNIPKNYRIVCIGWDDLSHSMSLYIEDPSMPDAMEGEVVPVITPYITKTTNMETGLGTFTWHWNLPEDK